MILCSTVASFWLQQAQNIDWYKSPSIGLRHDVDNSYSWFDDGQLNTCYLAVDRHVEQGRGEQIAFYYDSPAAGVKQKISYAQLQQQVSVFLPGRCHSWGLSKVTG